MSFSFFKKRTRGFGFSIVEMIIGVAVFSMISISIYSAFSKVVDLVNVTKLKTTAIALINEQFELVRNLPYSDVGLKNGIPLGVLDHERQVVRNSTPFFVKTTIRNIDDDFDGTIGGEPNDLSPADYKMVEVEISCPICKNFTPISMTSTVAPKNLETTSTNGALFVQVFDASGQPISGVDVSIRNDVFVPSIIIEDSTNNNGIFQLVDTPPAFQTYEVAVSKDGYSSDQTYTVGDQVNPNPVKPHSTVAMGTITQISFAIDRLSTINFSSVNESCALIPDIDFNLKGAKLIGIEPDILKFDENLATDSLGTLSLNNIEWDTYSLEIFSDVYDLLGVNPEFPLSILPNETRNIQIVLAPKSPASLIVNVKDGATNLPLSGVLATLTNLSGFNDSRTTGQGFLLQNDWSGGSGQEEFLDESMFLSSERVDTSGGHLSLMQNGEEYFSSGSLISSTFNTGSPSNFYEISWEPESQGDEVGSDGVKFQIATNNDGETWDFLGPDGSDQSYYTLLNSTINSLHNGQQFLRYKVFLNTASTTYTPSVSQIAFTFASDCVSPGQTRFSGLANDTYHLLLEKTGYQPVEFDISVTGDSLYQETVLFDS